MPLGFVPGSGPWEHREFTTTSTATFKKGSLVELNGARTLVEYASTSSSYLGIACADSVNSTPSGKILVALPRAGCTAWTDIAPGLGSSDLSAAVARGVGKRGDHMSFVTTHHASVWSQIVGCTGKYDIGTTSGLSRAEVYFIQNGAEFYSTSSVSII